MAGAGVAKTIAILERALKELRKQGREEPVRFCDLSKQRAREALLKYRKRQGK